eukprot:14859736-Alexandrium_andersonii.AAC.1
MLASMISAASWIRPAVSSATPWGRRPGCAAAIMAVRQLCSVTLSWARPFMAASNHCAALSGPSSLFREDASSQGSTWSRRSP